MKSKHSEKAFLRIQEFLNRENFSGFTAEDLFIKQFIPKGWGQDIAALSNMAEALRNLYIAKAHDHDDLKRLIGRVVAFAQHTSVSPWKRPITENTKLGGHGYYLEHLNIILGCYQWIADSRYQALNTRISKHLVALTMEHPLRHARLMPRVNMRWSADQAAILYSLWLYDQNNLTSLHVQPTSDWLSIMERQLTHAGTGLFQTEALNVKPYSKQPRGCSCAYMIYYMSYFAPTVAVNQWTRFKANMLDATLGMQGFREYLPEYKGGWTPDSGPIIGGVGIASSALAMKTAAALNDDAVQHKIIKSADKALSVLSMLGHIPAVDKLTRIGSDLLASSILLSADTTAAARSHLTPPSKPHTQPNAKPRSTTYPTTYSTTQAA